MLLMLILGLVFGTLVSCVWAALLAPLLRFCFKVVVGEANTFGDAWSICFKGTMVYMVFSVVSNAVFAGEQGDENGLVIQTLSLCAQLAIYTWLVAREIGELAKSFLVAFLLTGLTYVALFLLLGMLGIMAFASGGSVEFA